MKSASEILTQKYMTAEDLTIVINGLSIYQARKYINEAREKMELDGCFIPQTRKKTALTSYLKKKFKF